MPSEIRIPKSEISIIIPAYNEEASIAGVLDSLREWRERAEVIVIDDASTDRTAAIAETAGVRVLKHLHNKGYGAALKTGIRAAAGDVVVMMDADSEHSAAEIQRLVDALGDYDMVVGARGKGSNAPLVRRPGKWILGKVANYLAQTKIPDLNSGFRAVRTRVAKLFLHILPNGFSFTTTLTLALFKEGYNTAYVPITTRPRVGASTVNPIRDGINTIMLIIRVVALFDPLKVFMPTSVVLFLIGVAYWIVSIIFRLNQRIDPAFHIPSGAVIVLVSSVIVFMFGILADQVSAIRREKYE
ncbi:MAG: glycosyltransferase family 2 protein [Chloroflexi bacterium]|nr:glycosyltransferase family 2 protein [Chloroflexota bacterium]